MRCPKCGRDTYFKKWNSCTSFGCSLNHSVLDTTPIPVHRVTKRAASASVTKVTGRPKVHTSAAEKQRAYRERRKAKA